MPCCLEQEKVRHAGEVVNSKVFWLFKEAFETGALCYLHLVFQNLYPLLDQDPESFENITENIHHAQSYELEASTKLRHMHCQHMLLLASLHGSSNPCNICLKHAVHAGIQNWMRGKHVWLWVLQRLFPSLFLGRLITNSAASTLSWSPGSWVTASLFSYWRRQTLFMESLWFIFW